MRAYQENYASIRHQMYDQKSRKVKALRIIKTLKAYFGKTSLNKLTLLDVGASTGIMDNFLAKEFKKVVGTDIDKDAIKFAKNNFKNRNLSFKYEDAMKLSFKDNSFDVVICTHVYEHVPDPQKLFNEIYRVLKPSGVCYAALQNKLWPLEAHHNLPFLSYLPKKYADLYIKIVRGKNEYYEHPMTYWELRSALKKFSVHEYTEKILVNPSLYGYEDKVPKNIPLLNYLISYPAKYFSPTLFWILEKK